MFHPLSSTGWQWTRTRVVKKVVQTRVGILWLEVDKARVKLRHHPVEKEYVYGNLNIIQFVDVQMGVDGEVCVWLSRRRQGCTDT